MVIHDPGVVRHVEVFYPILDYTGLYAIDEAHWQSQFQPVTGLAKQYPGG